MKKVWIVKRAPECPNGMRAEKKHFSGNNVKGYTYVEACNAAKHYAAQNQARYIVFEAVAAFEPASNVREVEIEDE